MMDYNKIIKKLLNDTLPLLKNESEKGGTISAAAPLGQ